MLQEGLMINYQRKFSMEIFRKDPNAAHYETKIIYETERKRENVKLEHVDHYQSRYSS